MKPTDVEDSAEGIAHRSPRLVRCFWCERLHPGDHPLGVCPACSARWETMRALEMSGAYPLGDDEIDRFLERKSAGNYALGYMDGDAFHVLFIGRSDSDLRQCLHDWVNAPSRYSRYAPVDKASWASRARAAAPTREPTLGRVGLIVDGSYTHFAYCYAPSAEAAFEKECRNYQDFGGRSELDNDSHPLWTPWSSRA